MWLFTYKLTNKEAFCVDRFVQLGKNHQQFNTNAEGDVTREGNEVESETT